MNASQASSFAIALSSAIKAITPPATATGKFTGLNYGYYLIVQTSGGSDSKYTLSDPFLVSIPDYTTVTIKASTANIEKKIVIGTDSDSEKNATNPKDLYDTSTAAVGDTVHFRSLSTIPTYTTGSDPTAYKITDTMSTGLVFDAASVQVYVLNLDGSLNSTLTSATDYTLTSDADGHGFNVAFTGPTNLGKIKGWGNSGSKILVTYSAQLNNTAPNVVNFGSTGNPNSVKLTYDTTTTPNDTVITYTTKLIINKQDTNGNSLIGATFTLTDSNNTVVDTATTDSTGAATFTKLKAGTYTLTETVAPAGYSTMAPTTITIKATNYNATSSFISDNTYQVTESGNDKVQTDYKATWSGTDNNTVGTKLLFASDATTSILSTTITDNSFTLPFSGGMGTTLFTAGGILLIAVAGTLLLVYNKKRKAAKR
jgi:hypothetical protein